VKSCPLKAQFSEDHISAPRGCCAPKFLHALENHQVLLAHPPPGAEARLTTFFKVESKIGLKCNKGALITSKLKGVARRNFGICAALGWGVNASTKFGGTDPLPPLKFGRTSHVLYVLRQLQSLTANIFKINKDSDII